MTRRKDNEYRAAVDAIVEFGNVVEEHQQHFTDAARIASQLDAWLRQMARAALPPSMLEAVVWQFAESVTARLTPLLEMQAQAVTDLVNDMALSAMQEGNLADKVREMAEAVTVASSANIPYAHLAEQVEALDRMLQAIDVASILGVEEDEDPRHYVETGGIVEVRVVSTGENELLPAGDVDVEQATTRRIHLSPRIVFCLSIALQLLPLVAGMSGDPRVAALFQTPAGQVMLRFWDICVTELRRNLEDPPPAGPA